jgi:ribosomal protein S15P/S13E
MTMNMTMPMPLAVIKSRGFHATPSAYSRFPSLYVTPSIKTLAKTSRREAKLTMKILKKENKKEKRRERLQQQKKPNAPNAQSQKERVKQSGNKTKSSKALLPKQIIKMRERAKNKHIQSLADSVSIDLHTNYFKAALSASEATPSTSPTDTNLSSSTPSYTKEIPVTSTKSLITPAKLLPFLAVPTPLQKKRSVFASSPSPSPSSNAKTSSILSMPPNIVPYNLKATVESYAKPRQRTASPQDGPDSTPSATAASTKTTPSKSSIRSRSWQDSLSTSQAASASSMGLMETNKELVFDEKKYLPESLPPPVDLKHVSAVAALNMGADAGVSVGASAENTTGTAGSGETVGYVVDPQNEPLLCQSQYGPTAWAYSISSAESVQVFGAEPELDAEVVGGDAREMVRRIVSLENASAKEVRKWNVKRVMDVLGRKMFDTGSPESQSMLLYMSYIVSKMLFIHCYLSIGKNVVGVMTVKVKAMMDHLEYNKKDMSSKRRLQALLAKRLKMLKYLRRKVREIWLI